jgi:hypothetical protein
LRRLVFSLARRLGWTGSCHHHRRRSFGPPPGLTAHDLASVGFSPLARHRSALGESAESGLTVAVGRCDVYVEDPRARTLLIEILTRFSSDLVTRCRVTPYGAASVGQSLGIMVSEDRFPVRTCVFLDGDKSEAPGCFLLPGGDAPERVVFDGLHDVQWRGLDSRVARDFPSVSDACNNAMTLSNHHDWVKQAAQTLTLGGDILWQAMCSAWVEHCADPTECSAVTQAVADTVHGIAPVSGVVPTVTPTPPSPPVAPVSASRPPNEPGTLFELSPSAAHGPQGRPEGR